MDKFEDMISELIVLFSIVVMIGWLLYAHTGAGEGQIQPVYWAGVATPLLSQIAKKMFNLTKPNK